MLAVPAKPLPPKFRRTSGGCDTCRNRHIRCDKALPMCGPCSVKGYDCPGYDKLFRFVVGPHAKTKRKATRSSSSSSSSSPSSECVASVRSPGTLSPVSITSPSPSPSIESFVSEHPELCRQKYYLDYFFHHYASRICLIEGAQNPFGENLKLYMRQSEALNLLIVAIAALHLANSGEESQDSKAESNSWYYRNLALGVLRNELQGKAGSIEVLLAVLFLGSTESWFDEKNSSSVHLDAAGRLLERRLRAGEDVPTFVVHWLSFLETLSNFVSDRKGLDLASPTLREYLVAQNKEPKLDPLIGSLGTLMPLVGRAGTIVRRLRKEQCKGNEKLYDLVDDLEVELLAWEHPKIVTVSDHNHLAEAYRLSALLTIYNYSPRHLARRATLIIGPDAPPKEFLATMARWAVEHLQQIPDNSTLWRICSIPVLTAGQLVTDPDERAFLQRRIAAVTSEAQVSAASKVETLLHDVWKRRDAGWDIWWIDVLDASGMQMLVN